ncbi:MAG: hypothetical protein IJ087_14370 [Eggerthellaceae bacterium]|nr:hypothetical protein [Eggerthellaceae bacterium]
MTMTTNRKRGRLLTGLGIAAVVAVLAVALGLLGVGSPKASEPAQAIAAEAAQNGSVQTADAPIPPDNSVLTEQNQPVAEISQPEAIPAEATPEPLEVQLPAEHAAGLAAEAEERPSSWDGEPQTAPEAAARQESQTARKWVVGYEEVWVPSIETVVDEPAHEEPVYEKRDVLVCNACGYEASGGNDMGAHLSAHALEGIDEGYSAMPRRVQVGTKSVPAVTHEVDNGHFERIEHGGHWE